MIENAGGKYEENVKVGPPTTHGRTGRRVNGIHGRAGFGPPIYRRSGAFAGSQRHQPLVGHCNQHSEPGTPAVFKFPYCSSGDTHSRGNADTTAVRKPRNCTGSDRLPGAVGRPH